MAYVKQTWVDRQVENPLTFTRTENSDGTITLTPAPGTVTAAGSQVSAERMNHIEDGIANAVIQGDFAYLTGTNTTPEADTANLTGTTTLDYPTGFTRDNCIIIGLMGQNSTNTARWTTTTPLNSFGMLAGTAGLIGRLTADNVLVIRSKLSTSEAASTSNVRVVLMKLPT